MKYRALDSNGDMIYGQSNQNFLTGTQAVAQAIRTRMKLLEGEWWENTTDGFPLFQEVLGVPATPNDLIVVDQVIQDRILGTIGVKSIDNFTSSFDYKTRSYSYQSIVTTEFGEAIPVTGVLA